MFGKLLRIILNLSNLFKDDFGEWIKTASDEDLRKAYDERRLTHFKKLGRKALKWSVLKRNYPSALFKTGRKNTQVMGLTNLGQIKIVGRKINSFL